MFKNLILVILIVLLAISATACPNGEEAAATEQKPTAPNIPAITDAEQTTPEKPIPVPEFIERALKGLFRRGDPVVVSGILIDKPERLLSPIFGCYYIVRLGPETAGRTVTFRTGIMYHYETRTNFKQYHQVFDGLKMAPGDEIVMVVSGTFSRITEECVRLETPPSLISVTK